MSAVTWHGAPALLSASDDPAAPWIVTLPEGHADLGYAPGSQFLADAADLREAGAHGHVFSGWAKVPSRRGALKSPRCTCGWRGSATHDTAAGMAQFRAHA